MKRSGIALFTIRQYNATNVDIWLDDFCHVYKEVFGKTPAPDQIKFITQQKNLLVLIAYVDETPVGFKAGYPVPNTPSRFYSWAGGTSPAYRKHGIASALMKHQHDACKDMGIKIIETKCKPTWPEMMFLNASFGFKVVKEYAGASGDLKYLLEKPLD